MKDNISISNLLKLDDISEINSPQIKYSKYAKNLDRIFKNNSVDLLQSKLKNVNKKKTVKPLKNIFEEKNKDEVNKNFIFDYNINEKNSSLNAKNKSIKIFEKVNYSDNLKHKKIDAINRIKILKEDATPDPGQYNPNYGSIRKRIPGFKYINIKKIINDTDNNQTYNLNLNNSDIRKSSINNQSILNDKSRLLNIRNSIGNVNHKKKIQNNISITENTPKSSYTNKNNALRFSRYSVSRDEKKKEWQLPIISYIEPDKVRYKTKGINFEKMTERENSKHKIVLSPSICYYEPKYEYIKKNSPQSPRFNNKTEKNVNKKYLLQKMWCSYEVSTDYKLVKL